MKSKLKVLVFILTVVLLCSSIPLTSHTMSGKPSSLIPKDVIYFGNVGGSETPWVFINMDGDKAILISQYILEERRFDSSGYNAWENSEICLYLNNTTGFLSNFSTNEIAAMVPYKLEQEKSNASPYGYNTQDINVNQRMVLPASKELNDDERYRDDLWKTLTDPEIKVLRRTPLINSNTYIDYFLRSNTGTKISEYQGNIAAFNSTGGGNALNNVVGRPPTKVLGVRPVFKLDTNSIILITNANNGKTATVGALGIPTALTPGAARKLTLLSSSKTLDITASPQQKVQNSENLELGYKNATLGMDQYVSCVLEDSSGAVKYYGKLTDSSSAAAGSLSIPLTGVPDGTYKLRIFSEQDNGDKRTDYASTPVEMKLTVSSGKGTISDFSGISSPSISQQPTSASRIEGETANFSVTASGTMPLSYQWQVGKEDAQGFVNINGATSANYATGVLNTGMNGWKYRVIVTNGGGSLTSGEATLFVAATGQVLSPTASPSSGQVPLGQAVTLTCLVPGTTIHYTIDGSTPTTSSTVYSRPIIINSAITIRAIGVAPGKTDSPVMREDYTIDVFIRPTVDPEVKPSTSINLDLNGQTTANLTITLGMSGNGTLATRADISSDNPVVAAVSHSTVVSNSNVTVSAKSVGNATITVSFDTSKTVIIPVVVTNSTSPTPDPDPTPSYSGGSSSSSSGGTSKADIAPVVQTGRAFTKAEATKLFNGALTSKPEGTTNISFSARNYTKADKSAFVELTALAKKNGVTLTVHFDTVVGKAVAYRISVNPALVTTNLDLTAKIVGGKITLPKFTVPVEVAVLLSQGLNLENLKMTQNDQDIKATAHPWLDKNGYLHFTTTGGEIVLGK